MLFASSIKMPTEFEFVTWISDPLYGSIPLTKIETDVINTQAFQRLRRVSQLGVVSLVFPSATYSRFTHSLGACHIFGQILEQLGHGRQGCEEQAKNWQKHRLAMVLHDVGHYFGAHAVESAAEDHYSSLLKVTPKKEIGLVGKERPAFLRHEDVGRQVLRNDEELRTVIEGGGYDPETIARVFSSDESTIFSNLVSSDLDADRLDYLMRSSQATGIPYGFLDRDFLIRKLHLMDNPKEKEDGQPAQIVALKRSAVRAADHFLLSRMFDYLQVIFQHDVVGFEIMLKQCVIALLRLGEIKLDKDTVIANIKENKWRTMDDQFLWSRFRSVMEEREGELTTLEQHCFERLLTRSPAHRLYSLERIVDDKRGQDFAEKEAAIQGAIMENATSKDNCILWSKTFRPLARPNNPSSKASDDDTGFEKAIRIECGDTVKPIYDMQESIASQLAKSEYQMLRVYVFGDQDCVSKVENELRKCASDHGLDCHS